MNAKDLSYISSISVCKSVESLRISRGQVKGCVNPWASLRLLRAPEANHQSSQLGNAAPCPELPVDHHNQNKHPLSRIPKSDVFTLATPNRPHITTRFELSVDTHTPC